MGIEHRTLGPPGSGKTRWLARQVSRALEKYEAKEIVACSFTRAAAVELAGRDTGLPEENIGTIHSICYRHLDKPTIIETQKELIEEWDTSHPRWKVTGKVDLDEPQQADGGDALLSYNRERACVTGRCVPAGFATAWEDFKRETGAVDFTDLLEQAPGSIGASVLFVDEAQDLTPLQWRVVRRWGEEAEVFVVCGDDDQLLYGFLGASPEPFLTPLPPNRVHTLSQTHRLPRSVFERAQRWIVRLQERRWPKDYSPRDEDGFVRESGHVLRRPERVVAEAEGHTGEGQTVMILASCRWMLGRVLKELRNRAVPFHNPYRRERQEWNPLQRAGRRILAFLRCGRALSREDRILPGGDWWQWGEMLKAEDALHRGAKLAMKATASTHSVSEDDLVRWLPTNTFLAMLSGDTQWLAQNLTPRWKRAMAYPLAVLRRHGEEALWNPPKIVVGTIHSVKGGEADVVYLFPDLSRQAERELQRHPRKARDALTRQVYVGMTRARYGLYLCRPSWRPHWRWS